MGLWDGMNDIFVNRTLNLKQITHIGFDMDHTLVRYNIEAFERLAHRLALEKLVSKFGYPKAVLDLPFELDRVIRGLVIDRKNGNFLKLSVRGAVRLSYHGTRRIKYKEQTALYRGTLIDLGDANFHPVDTSFTIAVAMAFAHLVDLKDGAFQNDLPSYEKMAWDVLDCVDEAHRDGSLKGQVLEQKEQFILQDPRLAEALERYMRHGKKLFVLTNSDYAYTQPLLDYAINPFLQEKKHWQEVFEYVITLASKPKFFFERRPFLKVDPLTGAMFNTEDPLKPGVYQGGCATTFTEDLGLNGEDILYVGDHIYGDILRLKKDCAWRTAMVIEELRDEIEKTKMARSVHDRIWELMGQKEPLERQLTSLEDEVWETDGSADSPEILALREKISIIDRQFRPLIEEHQQVFNPYWGEVMRIGNEESYFAGQVERYACVYASTLADLLAHSPRTYYRAGRKHMPHEE